MNTYVCEYYMFSISILLRAFLALLVQLDFLVDIGW